MIIERKNLDAVKFEELDIGNVFSFEGRVYIVLPDCEFGNWECNALELGNSELEYFPSNTKVIFHPKVRLVIEE